MFKEDHDYRFDPTHHSGTAAGAAAAAADSPRVFARRSRSKTGTGKFYERGPVHIYYEEAGSGFPLILVPGGGLNSTVFLLHRQLAF